MLKKRRGSRVKGGRVIQLPYLKVLKKKRGRGLEGFEGVSTISNPIIFNSPKLERFGGIVK